MQHLSTTPFGRRPVTADLLAARAATGPANVESAADKWAVLRNLGIARSAFGVTDRDLTVLQALLSFHPENQIRPASRTIVFPSNASLSARAHGMPESTLRRHLAALIQAGLVIRHDSPNGKRFAARGRAFGFDLLPLASRATEIAAAAEDAKAEAEAIQNLREFTVLALRDASKLIAFGNSTLGGCWDVLTDDVLVLQRALRRKLGLEAAQALANQAKALRDRVEERLPESSATNVSGNDVQNERHIQDSDKNIYESEAGSRVLNPEPINLETILEACPDVGFYSPEKISDWRSFVTVTERVGPMLGIDRSVISEAQRAMGSHVASMVIACLLQSFERIRSPGAYLRTLSKKAGAGQFTPDLMLQALIRRQLPTS